MDSMIHALPWVAASAALLLYLKRRRNRKIEP